MIVAALLVSLVVDEPRFTRTESPDAYMRAEIYARDGHDPAAQATDLLGGDPYQIIPLERPAGTVLLSTARPPNAPDQRTVLYLAHGDRQEWMCLLSIQQPNGRDNRREAVRWCLTFLDPPVVAIPVSVPEG